jgi:gluconate kinase
LLRSQIDTLEEPDPSEEPLTIDAGEPPNLIAEEIVRRLCVTTVIRGVPSPR